MKSVLDARKQREDAEKKLYEKLIAIFGKDGQINSISFRLAWKNGKVSLRVRRELEGGQKHFARLLPDDVEEIRDIAELIWMHHYHTTFEEDSRAGVFTRLTQELDALFSPSPAPEEGK